MLVFYTWQSTLLSVPSNVGISRREPPSAAKARSGRLHAVLGA
jgi:hypothetical protein